MGFVNDRPPDSLRRRLLKVALVSAFGLFNIGACGAFGAYVYFSQDVPSIAWAEDYRPPGVTTVWSGDDQLVGEFYDERRNVVPYEKIPPKLVQAFVASEDQRFFDH